MPDFNPRDTNEGKDKELDGIIRPRELEDFTGQKEIVSNLKVYIQAAKMRGETLDHTLFHGPPGLGKTTLAHIIANEMGVNMKITSGPVLDRPGSDLHVHPHLISDDMCESGLSQTGRTMEKGMVEGLAAEFCRLDVNPQIRNDFALSCKIFEFPGADNSVQFLIFAFVCIAGVEIRHWHQFLIPNTNIVLFYF